MKPVAQLIFSHCSPHNRGIEVGVGEAVRVGVGVDVAVGVGVGVCVGVGVRVGVSVLNPSIPCC